MTNSAGSGSLDGSADGSTQTPLSTLSTMPGCTTAWATRARNGAREASPDMTGRRAKMPESDGKPVDGTIGIVIPPPGTDTVIIAIRDGNRFAYVPVAREYLEDPELAYEAIRKAIESCQRFMDWERAKASPQQP